MAAVGAWTRAVARIQHHGDRRHLDGARQRQSLAAVRGRAFAVTFAAVGAVICALGLIPLPLHTVAEGVVWLPEESIVRTTADGFVTQLAAQPGSSVAQGTGLLRSDDYDLASD